MNIEGYGFFVGLAPGLIYVLRNMAQFNRVVSSAQEVARNQGGFLDPHFDPVMRFNFLLRPQRFVSDTDNPGVRAGKELILAARKRYFRRHAIGIIFVVVGALIGFTIGLAVGSSMPVK